MALGFTLVSLAILSVVAAGVAGGANILLLPIDHRPHVNFIALAAKSLIKAGHNATILTMSQHKELLVTHGVPHILHSGVEAKPMNDAYDELAETSFRGGLFNLISLYIKARAIYQLQCREMHQSVTILKALEEQKFDFAIVDYLEVSRCLYSFPYRLGIPYISLTDRYEPWLARVPALPSVEGFLGLYYMPRNSSILDRGLNTLLHILYYAAASWVFDDNVITDYVSHKPPTTYSELFQKSEMVLVNLETLCLDTPRVTSPHYQFIAGLSNRPAEPLPEELESFVNGAKHGIIVVSFGSVVRFLPDIVFNKLMNGFRQIEQMVIMRYHSNSTDLLDKVNHPNVPSNVKAMNWLPQNDLLGHSKTRLFITHAGNHGQLEAVYHGVPMLSIPLFDDQFYDATRAEARGFGLTLDWKSFTSRQLVETINEIITNPKYKHNIDKCMNITKDFPTPQERMTFWVEHVLKFGSSHLRPSYMEMPLWKFFMLDVILVMLLFLTMLIYGCYLFWRFLIKTAWGPTSKQKSE